MTRTNLSTLLLTLTLVSCHPAPAIAGGMSAFVSIPLIAARYQNHDHHRKEFLAPPPVALYSGGSGQNSQLGLAARYTWSTPAHAGFLCVYSPARYGGLCGETFGSAGSKYRSANPVQPATRGLAASGGGVSPILGVTTMTTPARIPSAARQRSIKITALILLSLKTGAKTGTLELQQRIAREGIPVTLRTVQRRLAELSAVLPIEGDGASPQGWRWKADTAATVARVAGGAA